MRLTALAQYEKRSPPTQKTTKLSGRPRDLRSTSAPTLPTRFEAQATLYDRGEQYARRSVALKPGDAEGHFALARALGKTAL